MTSDQERGGLEKNGKKRHFVLFSVSPKKCNFFFRQNDCQIPSEPETQSLLIEITCLDTLILRPGLA